ncbi:hypothetical protein [Dolichospermum phage Dfl-JY45]
MSGLPFPGYRTAREAETAALRMAPSVGEALSVPADCAWGTQPPVLFHGTPSAQPFGRFRTPAFFSFSARTAALFQRASDADDSAPSAGRVIPVYALCKRIETTDDIAVVESVPYDAVWRRRARARGVDGLLYRGEDGDELAVLDARCIVSAVMPAPLLSRILGTPLPSHLDGEVALPGVVADVVGSRGAGVSIYSWSGDGSGRTRSALAALRCYGGAVYAHDIGSAGSESYRYWKQMASEGLVDDCFDAEGNQIAWADAPHSAGCSFTRVTA